MAKKIADKNILEGLAIAAMAAESFLKIYYRARKELEESNTISASPARIANEKKIAEVIGKRRRAIMRNVL